MRLSLSVITGLNRQFDTIKDIYSLDRIQWFCTPDLYFDRCWVVHVTVSQGDHVVRISRPLRQFNCAYIGFQVMEFLDQCQIPKNSFKLYAKQLTDENFSSL
jgi:hypothetical protein